MDVSENAYVRERQLFFKMKEEYKVSCVKILISC